MTSDCSVLDKKIVNNTEYKLVFREENGVKTKLWIPECSGSLKMKSELSLRKPILDVETKITHLYEQLKKASDAELLALQKKVVRCTLHELPPSTKEDIRGDLMALLRTHKMRRKICPAGVRKLRHRILLEEMTQNRRYQLSVLFCLEKEINLVAKCSKKIRVENFVDLEVLPFNFSYANKILPGKRVTFPKNPPIGCDCIGERICVLNNCCPEMFSRRASYNEYGLVMVPPETAIYECNRNCKCVKKCANRIVQRGSNVKLMVFRTQNCGWGVRALENIQKGSFVIEYTGEVITREDALERSKNNANVKDHLFDLHFNTDDGECKYTIDSTSYGNVSRFLNHSCEPNLDVYSVWIDWSDPDIYHLAFFAARDIHVDEELTFDYARLSKSRDRTTGNCKCGSNSCHRNTVDSASAYIFINYI